MSYSLNTPCWGCSKQGSCTDESDVREAVTKIHSKSQEQGHKGAGQIVLACCNQNRQ